MAQRLGGAAGADLGHRRAGALAQARSGGTLNWIVSPEPASIVPLTTTAGANPQVTILAKKVKNYAPTAEGIRGSFSELYLQE